MSKVLRFERCPKCERLGKDTRGDNLAIYSDGGAHCFSNCGYHRFPKRYQVTRKESSDASTVLPSDFTREVPAKAWQWLLQYGLSWRYWQPWVGWSEKDTRLVFTVGNPTDFSTGRYLGDEKRAKWFHYGDCHKRAHIIGDPLERANQIVLVEDVISAHKVGQVFPAIPLLGTNLFDALVPVLRHLRLPVVMWLDKDQEQHAMKRAFRLSVLTGLKVRYVFTNDDPKSCSLDKIKEVLQ